MKIAITGSSGLIGSALHSALDESGDKPLRIVRDRTTVGDDVEFWDPAIGQINPGILTGVDAVVHLSGLGIGDRRWSSSRKAALRASRVDSGELLSKAIASLERPPQVFISASATGIYGNRGNEILDENSTTGGGFLASLTEDWEASYETLREKNVRVVLARFGVVVAREGDFLRKLLPIFRLGFGGTIGSGRQWLSWIHLNDAIRSILFALRTPELTGAYNAVAPNPVTNTVFARALGSALGRPSLLKVPAFAIRLALGQMGMETSLFSTRAVPKRLETLGFEFNYPQLAAALRAELGS